MRKKEIFAEMRDEMRSQQPSLLSSPGVNSYTSPCLMKRGKLFTSVSKEEILSHKRSVYVFV